MSREQSATHGAKECCGEWDSLAGRCVDCPVTLVQTLNLSNEARKAALAGCLDQEHLAKQTLLWLLAERVEELKEELDLTKDTLESRERNIDGMISARSETETLVPAQLATALQWCVENEGECLGDHTMMLRQAKAALKAHSSSPSAIEPISEWVWWNKGDGIAVGPRDKGCEAIVFTVDEAQAICRAVNRR